MASCLCSSAFSASDNNGSGGAGVGSKDVGRDSDLDEAEVLKRLANDAERR